MGKGQRDQVFLPCTVVPFACDVDRVGNDPAVGRNDLYLVIPRYSGVIGLRLHHSLRENAGLPLAGIAKAAGAESEAEKVLIVPVPENAGVAGRLSVSVVARLRMLIEVTFPHIAAISLPVPAAAWIWNESQLSWWLNVNAIWLAGPVLFPLAMPVCIISVLPSIVNWSLPGFVTDG